LFFFSSFGTLVEGCFTGGASVSDVWSGVRRLPPKTDSA